MSWDSKRRQMVKQMWNDGCSFKEIAIAVGVSRSAVSGYIFREGLQRKGTGEKPMFTPRLTYEPSTQKMPKVGDVVFINAFRSSKPLPLVDRNQDWFEDWSGRAMIDMVDGRYVRFIGEDGHWGWVRYDATHYLNPVTAIIDPDVVVPPLQWSTSALHFMKLGAD